MIRKRRRGVALVLSMFFLTLLGLLASAMARMLPVELNAATRASNDLKSFYAASAGVDAVLAKLKYSYPATVAVPTTLTGMAGDYVYTANITRPPGCNPFTYKVDSWARRKDLPIKDPARPGQRQVTAFIVQRSLSEFNFFGQGSGSWNMLAQVEGPAHFGGDITLWAGAGRWAQNFVTFHSIVTSPNPAGPTNIAWYGSDGAPNTDAEWDQVTPDGESGILYGYGSQMAVPDPDHAAMAYGGALPANLATGIHVPVTGSATKAGIVIKPQDNNNNKLKDMNFSVDSATGNQVVKVVMGSDTYNIVYAEAGGTVTLPGTATTLTVAPNKTIVVKNGNVGTASAYDGLTNGLIHVEGDIGSYLNSKIYSGLSGMIKGDASTDPAAPPSERAVTASGTIALDGPMSRADIQELYKNNAPNPLPAGDEAGRYADPVNADHPFHPPSKAELKTWKNAQGQVEDKSHLFCRDNLMVFAKGDLLVSLDPTQAVTNPHQNNKIIMNLFGQFIARGSIRVVREQGANTGEFNVIGALAQQAPLQHDQFINSNSGGGNDDWDMQFLHDAQMAFEPSNFVPGLNDFTVKTFSEEVLDGH